MNSSAHARMPVGGLLRVSLGSGSAPMPGFIRIDLDPATVPDRVMDVRTIDLEPGSVAVLYASHVLEHFEPPPGVSRWEFLIDTLRAWRRCLSPSGVLYLGVPDALTLADILRDNPAHDIQIAAMDALLGGGRNQFDHHHHAFTGPLLRWLLEQAGFAEAAPFTPFVADETGRTIMGRPISLNLVASVSTRQPSGQLESPFPSPFETSELEALRKAADDRLQLIHVLRRQCEEKQEEINNLLAICREREQLIFRLEALLKQAGDRPQDR